VDRLPIAFCGPVDVARILAAGGVTIAGERYTVDRRRARNRPLGLAGPGIDVEASEDMAIVDLRARYLATHTPGEAVAMAERIARALCSQGGGMDSGEVWAVDLCADIAGATFKAADLDAMITRLRSAETFRTRERRTVGASVVTGLSVGSTAAILVTIYNKSAELKQTHAAERAAMERDIWTRRGWDSRGDVWRVEIKLRGRVLTEYGLRDPAGLAAQIDGVWQAIVTKRVRLVDLSTATRRERCKMDPRWEALQEATFVHASAAPVARERGRVRASTVASSVGSMVSTLHASGVSRAEAERLLAPILARVGTPDDIAALPARLDRAWGLAGRQRPRSVGPEPHKAGTKRARSHAA
jgi:hypothetical protein